MNHLLSIEELSQEQIEKIVDLACVLKKDRKSSPQVLTGQQWALIFTKSSTRTRVSFEVGIRELGGQVMFLSGADIQLGRGEPIKDTARVMGRMIHGAVIRTFAQQDVVDFASSAAFPRSTRSPTTSIPARSWPTCRPSMNVSAAGLANASVSSAMATATWLALGSGPAPGSALSSSSALQRPSSRRRASCAMCRLAASASSMILPRL
jgi:hypothetical protein